MFSFYKLKIEKKKKKNINHVSPSMSVWKIILSSDIYKFNFSKFLAHLNEHNIFILILFSVVSTYPEENS